MTIRQFDPPGYAAEEERRWRERAEGVIVAEAERLMTKLAEADMIIFKPLRLWETRALKLLLEKLDAGDSFGAIPSDRDTCLKKSLAWQVEHELGMRDDPFRSMAKVYALPSDPDDAA